jgi:hypothetical protein
MTFTYDILLTYDENRGHYLRNYHQAVGHLVEKLISEFDPDPESKHLGTGGKVDYINSTYCFEQKINPSTDNSSSRKTNLKKGKQYAEEHNLEFVYAYLEDRPKNMYIKDDVLHVHGAAIFELLGIPDKWDSFLNKLENEKRSIIDRLRNEFEERFGSYKLQSQTV